MSDEMTAAAPDPGHDNVVLLYDYSKHLLSLALLGVGGIISLTQSAQGKMIPPPVVAMMLIFLALAGFCALNCSAIILRARQKGEEVGKSAWISSRLAMLFLGASVGGFLIIWIDTLL